MPIYSYYACTPHMLCGKPSASLWCASLMYCVCSLASVCTPKLHVKYMYMLNLKVLHVLNMQTHVHVKFKFSCTIYIGLILKAHLLLQSMLTQQLHNTIGLCKFILFYCLILIEWLMVHRLKENTDHKRDLIVKKFYL